MGNNGTAFVVFCEYIVLIRVNYRQALMSYKQKPSINDLLIKYESALESANYTFFNEETYSQLIDYFLEDQQIDRAMEAVEQALTHHPFSADFYLRKADLLIHQHEHQQALDTLRIAENFAPGNFDIQLMKAEALSDNGFHQEALDMLEMLGTCVSEEELTDLYVTKAHIYDNQESYEQMFFVLQSALHLNPSHQGALEGMWICIEATKRYAESIDIHRRVIDDNPYSYLAWYNLGHAYAYMGQYGDAIEAFEFAFLSNEEFEFAYREYAELSFEIKDYRKALEGFQEILRRFPPDSDLMLRCGQCFMYLDLHDVARQYFKEAISFDPMNDEAYFHIGECYAFENQWTKAIVFYERALEIENFREEYYLSMGETLCHLAREAEAEEYYLKAIKLAPEEYYYWLKYTTYLLETNQPDEALRIVMDGEEEAPSTILYYARIACLFVLGKRQEALYRLGEALTEDFDQHISLFDVVPTLELDPEVLTMIMAYRP